MQQITLEFLFEVDVAFFAKIFVSIYCWAPLGTNFDSHIGFVPERSPTQLNMRS